MRISKDKEKYMKYYLDSLCFSGELRIGAIKRMTEYKGEGAEYISSSFDSDDEDYKEGYVTLIFWEPADDEDTMVYVENDFFYKGIEEICSKDIKKNPKNEGILNNYLEEIRVALRI